MSRACAWPEKVPHATRWAATTAAISHSLDHPDQKPMHAYPCPAGHWHIGHASGGLSKRVRRVLRGDGLPKRRSRRNRR